MIRGALTFVAAMVVAPLPFRVWQRLPGGLQLKSAAFVAGILTLLAGAAVGIPGFLEHAAANVSMANAVQVATGPINRSLTQGFAGMSLYTFLLLTPKGWLTMYLAGTGAVRAGSAWFDDPVGDPVLTGLDAIAWGTHRRLNSARARRSREGLEGAEIPDRAVSGANAGIPSCDLVIVSSRSKPGWSRGVVVYTADTCYRIGDPVERMIAGHLRTLYPLTEHTDLEAVRKSVNYDLPL